MNDSGSMPHGPLALHTWTLGERPLGEVLQVAARTGYDAVETNWLDLGRCRDAGLSQRQITSLVAEIGIPVAVVGVEPGWLFADGSEADRLWDGFRRTAEAANALGCRTLMSATGRNDGPIARAEANMRKAAALSASCGVRLAVEFNVGHPTLRTLELMRDLVRQAESPQCGLVVDTYHLHRSGRAGRGFEDVTGEEVFHFQFSDVPSTPLPQGVPLDRLPPGQGQVDWPAVLGLLFEKGYSGILSYEAPNPALWRLPPDETARQGLIAIHRFVEELRVGRVPQVS